MEAKSVESDNTAVADQYYLGTWTRIYLHGAIAFVVVWAIAYLVTRIAAIFEFTGNRSLAVLLSISAIAVVPPLIGSLILYGVFPLLGLKEGWRGLVGWDVRLFSELSSARQNARIVIINWPSREVRTMGVLTATFSAGEGKRQLAAVYVPTAPQPRFGYIRIVPVDEVEFTELTLREWQLYQVTSGSVSPDRLS